MTVEAVLFDVDFTLAKPGPLLGPTGYQEAGKRFGLDLDPERYAEARAAAILDLQQHPELEHDEEIWLRFTEDIVRGMGGKGDAYLEWLVGTVKPLVDRSFPTRAERMATGIIGSSMGGLIALYALFGQRAVFGHQGTDLPRVEGYFAFALVQSNGAIVLAHDGAVIDEIAYPSSTAGRATIIDDADVTCDVPEGLRYRYNGTDHGTPRQANPLCP